MANVSHQSKQKQQTSRKESPTPIDQQTNGQTEASGPDWPDKNRIYLSREQANLFKQLLANSQEAQNQVQLAMVAAGISSQQIIGGDLDAERPYFAVVDNDIAAG